MAISILIAQQKKIKQLEQKLNELLMQRSGEQTRSNEPAVRGNF